MSCDDAIREELLQGEADHFGGVVLDPAGLPSNAEDFGRRLDHSLRAWRKSGTRGVWLQIPIEKAHLIGAAVARGFVFHHAEKHYCMLTQWLPLTEPDPLPANASTQVGVGALVVNDEGKVLLVQEAVGPLQGRDLWKIPTGLLSAREDIKDGVVRECLEETGVAADFEKVLGFRHSHAAMFGKSDIFFVCLLRAKGRDVPFRVQEGEIAKAMWGDFHEFLQQSPYPRDTPLWAELYGRCVGESGVVGDVPGIRAEQVKLHLRPGAASNYLYF